MMKRLYILLIMAFSAQTLFGVEPTLEPQTLPTQEAATQTISTKPTAPLTTLEAAASEPQAPTVPTEPEIYLNFQDASLASVLNYLTDRQNVDVIPHKDLQNVKVSLMSRKPMTLSQAWEAMYTLLEANGFTIATVNGVHRVVSTQEQQQNPLPCYSSAKGIAPEDLEDTNKVIRYIYFCSNISVNVAQGILTPLLAERSVQVNSALQACIITEKSLNIKTAMRIVKELDAGGLRQAIKIKQLKHTNADHITRLFNEHIIQKNQEQQGRIRVITTEKKHDPSHFSKDTKIIPDVIHNRLILMGTNDAIDKVIDFVDKYLDIPLGSAKSRLHVRECKYIAAEKLKGILERIIQPPSGQGGDQGATEGEYRFFEDVIISAETPHTGGEDEGGRGFGNRLIISCSDTDWQRLNAFIEKLDKAQPQVALEIMIVDVKSDDERALGAQVRNKTGALGKNIEGASFMLPGATYSVGQSNMITDIRGSGDSLLSPHSTILSFGSASRNDVWAVIRAAYKIDHTNIVSQPYLVANNNSPCEENVTMSRRIPGRLESTSSTSLTRRIESVDANVRTQITPRINASGIIELALEIEVSEFKEDSTDSPDKSNRLIKTRTSMAAGEVLVLGGLTSSKHDTSDWKVPILGDLPLVGNLFRDRSKTRVKKNLYIFIRPTVLKPHFGPGADEYTRLKLDYAKYQILGHDDYATSGDPIKRYFFAPSRYGIKNKLSDIAENRMPIIDNFSERKRMPGEVDIQNDHYFHPKKEDAAEQEVRETYEPTFSNISMPHVNPAEYIAPGLLESTFSPEVINEIQRSMSEEAPPSIVKDLPDLPDMQQRGEVVSNAPQWY